MNDTPATPPRATRQRRSRTTEPSAEQQNAANQAMAQQQTATDKTWDDEEKPAAAPRAERPPMRSELREPVRDVSPRDAADARAEEILGHLGGVDEGTDEFYVDPKRIPDGWSYEWKRNTVHGQHDPAYAVALARMGWTAVPARRHPEMMPDGWSGNTIERKGQILMERPQRITDMVRNRDNMNARNQVRVKEQQLSTAPSKDQLPRAGDGVKGDPDGIKPKIGKTYEPMPVPQK